MKAGISAHFSPTIKSERDKWLRFVPTHRANFNPTGRFFVCSVHFAEECFSRAIHMQGCSRRLIPGSVPTVLLAVRCSHPVLDNGFPSSVPFEPEEPQKSSMEGINMEGVEHLFYVTHHGGILSPETC